jgi:hypothetical protein
VCESVDGFAAGGLRGPIVVDASVPAGFEGGEVFHRDHRRPRRGGVVGDLAVEVKRQFPVDLSPFDADSGAVPVEDGDLRVELCSDLGGVRSRPAGSSEQLCGAAVDLRSVGGPA